MVGTDVPPLLLTLHGHKSEKQSFYNILQNRHQTTSLPILCNGRVLGSAYGWLAVVDPSEGDCFLWNPTTLQLLELQDLEAPLTYDKCFLSKPPTEPGCFIVFNQHRFGKQCVYEIGDGIVTTFNINSKEEGYSILAMVSLRGVVYGLINPGFEFVTINMDEDEEFGIRTLLIDGEQPLTVPQPTRSWVTVNKYYLMESPCGNELLLVIKMCFNVYLSKVVQFRVFRVDINRMECEELDNLDGRTIFINYYGNGFCRSSESTSGAGIKHNSIYYTNERSGPYIYVYNMDDRSSITLLPCLDADIDPNTSENYWVDLPENYWVDLPDISSSSGLV